MASVAPRRTRLARADRMEQTLTVARSLFAERGYSAVTMDEVAAEVGVTKPLLYNYFGNKEGLYIACMERAGDALSATIAASVAATRPRTRRCAPAAHAFFAFLDSDRAAWAVLFDETLPRARRDRRAGRRLPRPDPRPGHRLDHGPGAHRMRPAAKVEVEALSVALLGAAEALAHWWLRTEALSAEEAADLLIATIEPGLRLRWAPESPNRTSKAKSKGTDK